ncbi:hypothetical protein JNJ66_00060 [Candidatus Saccharibacteria bacterium]|nr:hypothetical protein [Candidatus Saccharibacteria bacterium]
MSLKIERKKFDRRLLAGLILPVLALVPAIALTGGHAETAQTERKPAPATRTGMKIPRLVTPPQTITDPTQPLPPPQQQRPFIFGMGAELDPAIDERLVAEAPVKMLSSWYNGPNDLNFMRGWKNGTVADAYARGYKLHLIVYNNGTEQNLSTKYGAACGRAYPLSVGFLNDMKELATIFNGSGELYVSMFTELQTYPCQDNNWVGSENYYRALQDQYRSAMAIFRQYAPNSKMSLSFGGWVANWDDPAKFGGKSLLLKFADVMNESDFQSFQAMATQGDNKELILRTTEALKPYGPVMISHYKPDNASQTSWNTDIDAIFTDDNITTLQNHGVFAFSFMDADLIRDEAAYQKVKAAVTKYAR